jgi:hypothetical protein
MELKAETSLGKIATRVWKKSRVAHHRQRLYPEASVAERPIALPPANGSTNMAKPLRHHSRTLCIELPTERDAMTVAERIAKKLAEGPRSGVVRVTDEHGNVVGEVRVLGKH